MMMMMMMMMMMYCHHHDGDVKDMPSSLCCGTLTDKIYEVANTLG